MKLLPLLPVGVTNEEEGEEEAVATAEEVVEDDIKEEEETMGISVNVMMHGSYRILMATEWRCIQRISSTMMNGIRFHKQCNSNSYK